MLSANWQYGNMKENDFKIVCSYFGGSLISRLIEKLII
jgi:hypothetical protein